MAGDQPDLAILAAPTERAASGPEAISPETRKTAPRRNIRLGAAGAVRLAAALAIGIPWIVSALNTVSTDDAYVNRHVTFAATRVRGQVARILVDDNNRVRRGDLLIELDLASQVLENLRQQQASALSYFDCFWIFALVTRARPWCH